jgi:hypothetical protein
MSIGGQPPVTAGKVPVWQTAVESYRFVFANLDRFLALGWLPLLITFAAYMGSDVLDDVGGGEDASVADWVTHIALEAASLAVYAVFAVRWHRFFLHDDRESVFSEIFSARDWRFLGYTLLLFYSPFVPMLALLLISEFVSGLFGIAGFVLLFVMTRFCLVLPSTAVDRPLGLGEAWHKMLGHTWRFIRAFLLVLIPSVILAWIVPDIFDLYQSTGTTNGAPEPTIGVLVATNVVLAIVGFFATAAGITVLSKFYRHIVGGERGEGGVVTVNRA